MSEANEGIDGASRPARSERDIAAELRLRPDPPRVMRLSRKSLAGLALVGGLGLGAILIVALQDRRPSDRPPELVSTGRAPQADGLSQLPRDYAGVPALGPPLPGDLGRPILGARARGVGVPTPEIGGPAAPAVDPEEQRRLDESEAARLSRLFADASTAVPTQPPGFAASSGAETLAQPEAQGLGPPDTIDRRVGFLEKEVDRRTTSGERLAPTPGPYVLQAGSVIPAALTTGLRSDLPGQITAQVTAHVYDSPTGRHLLIPQGSRLLGEYDSRVAFGQRRLLLAWTRLILPDGRSIVLERQPGADAAGYAGLEDRVDRHWGGLFLAAGLATVLNVGTELGSIGDGEIASAVREGAQDTIGRAGDEVVRRQLAVPPTLTIRPGFPVRVMVTRDLVLEPDRRR